ncbi:hypothetical protein GCM10007301_47280 [Azorhizobium oxalatiphilum]|uniref:Uncharacterized protein n=1 Tax=Azorhizobium oxalatiphilum TaxID=980631 RepID=A0A917CBK7_9HYPH|nr:hypothetical protein [Azorhizobium oxalatiphilum]GGF81688.1 hypothetical protein GCM10007301_47280 [Azorhizobium oxalatiphilum]
MTGTREFDVTDLRQAWIIDRREALEEISARRHEGHNSIWISLRGSDLPNLNVAFNGNLAVVNACNLSGSDTEIAVSMGDGSALPLDDTTTFFLTEFGIGQPMENSVVVDAGRAIRVLLDFFDEPTVRSTAIDWLEL